MDLEPGSDPYPAGSPAWLQNPPGMFSATDQLCSTVQEGGGLSCPRLSSSPVRLGGSLPSDSCPYGEGWAGWGLRAGRDEAAEPQRRKQMGPRLNRFVLSRPAFATHTQLCPQMSQKRP